MNGPLRLQIDGSGSAVSIFRILGQLQCIDISVLLELVVLGAHQSKPVIQMHLLKLDHTAQSSS